MKQTLLLAITTVLLVINATNVSAATKGPGQNCEAPGDTCQQGYICTYADPDNQTVKTCERAVGAGGSSSGVDIDRVFTGNFIGSSPYNLGYFVSSILGRIYGIALILVLAYLVWGAYRWLMSGGDPKALQGAKAHLTWAVVGMVIIFLSFGAFQLLNSLLNFAFG